MIPLLFALALESHASDATLAILPADTTVAVGDTLMFRVELGTFPVLKAFSLKYRFDPKTLEFLGAKPGDVLTGNGRPYSLFVLKDHVAPADTAGMDCAQLEGTTQGPGALVFLQFRAKAKGKAKLDCVEADLRDDRNARTLPHCGPAVVRVATPPPARGRGE